ncbi:hypothetical protein, partial [Microcystis sp. M179S2]|uniref:hypothetical protein n=1 Tax=Microcystis sp. M179S2 TaxID=2771160 RepID=UPI00258BE62E
MGKWGSGVVGSWGSGEVGKWGAGEMGEFQLTELPPYRNTKKLTKPLLQVASQKKLKRGYWVHFSLENGCTVDCIWSR